MSARWAFVGWNNLSISLFAQNKSGRCIPASQQPASSTACIDLLSNAAEYHPILSFKKSNSCVKNIASTHQRCFTNKEKCGECKDEENECGGVKLDPGYTW